MQRGLTDALTFIGHKNTKLDLDFADRLDN